MKAWLVALFLCAMCVVSTRAATAQKETTAPKSLCTEPLTTLFERLAPAVVFVSAVSINPLQQQSRGSAVIGSGVIVDAEGLIVTNSHVVFGYRALAVTLENGYTAPAKLLGADPILDLAVLRIPPPETGLPKISLGDSEALKVGEEVVAIGNPLGLEQTLTRGIISGINRLAPESPLQWTLSLLQTDAAINPGSSGGPLVNRCGEVVGITSAILTEAQNIGFAIPINLAKQVMPQLVQHGHVIRPWIGVNGKFIGQEIRDLLRLPLVDGFLIETIEPGSPAAKVGLHEGELLIAISGEEFLFGGDIITSINGKTTEDPEKFTQLVRELKVGDTVRLALYYEGKTRHVEFLLPERPILPGDVPPDSRRTLAPQRLPRPSPWRRR